VRAPPPPLLFGIPNFFLAERCACVVDIKPLLIEPDAPRVQRFYFLKRPLPAIRFVLHGLFCESHVPAAWGEDQR